MAAEDDDPLGAETLRGDHAAEADGAVSDDGQRLVGAHLCGDGGVVAVPITSERVRNAKRRFAGTSKDGSDGTRTRDLRRDRPAF
jgi:hypothetical protein